MLSSSLSDSTKRPFLGLLALIEKVFENVTVFLNWGGPRAHAETWFLYISFEEGSGRWFGQMRQLYSVQQVCNQLQVSRATLYRLIKAGQIEVLHVRSLTRFTESAIEKFLKTQQVQSRENEVGF